MIWLLKKVKNEYGLIGQTEFITPQYEVVPICFVYNDNYLGPCSRMTLPSLKRDLAILEQLSEEKNDECSVSFFWVILLTFMFSDRQSSIVLFY